MLSKKQNCLARLNILLIVAVLFLVPSSIQSEINLPSVFGSHMVIQQKQPIVIWGDAEPDETITVNFRGQTVKTQTDVLGRWKLVLNSANADSEPSSMTISGSRSPALTLTDILVGEVWLCSGQSNMELRMDRTHTPGPEILRARYPKIRLFQIPRKAAAEPQFDVEAAWEGCTPETIRDFSAVGFYFGLELHQNLNIPIGLIESAWGGTRIEPWTPIAGFESVQSLKPLLEDIRQAALDYREIVKQSLAAWKKWVTLSENALANKETPPAAPDQPQHPLAQAQQPTALYNGMIHPVVPFALQGAIWYQGESNRADGLRYRSKMEALIQGWRQVWDNPDLSFFFVQLAPFNYAYDGLETEGDVPDFYRLPLIWEAQKGILALPRTGMAVVTDITNLYDIHPQNKKEVGRRLSLWALAQTYKHEDVIFSGPLYSSMERRDNRIRLTFDHIGSGLISLDGNQLTWFEIAGEDHIFYKARAEIQGHTVVVWSPLVESPVAARMGWHQLAVPNLGNREGLPASPFRTDRW